MAMRGRDLLIEELKSKLNGNDMTLRVACQESFFHRIPRELLGRICLLIISENRDQRARFLSFMNRNDLFKYPIKVLAYCEEQTNWPARGITYDYVIIETANKSIYRFIEQLLKTPVNRRSCVQVWCPRRELSSVLPLVGKEYWKLNKLWAKSEVILDTEKRQPSGKGKKLFRDEENLED